MGLEAVRAREDGQAVGLVDPELIVVLGQMQQVRLDVGHVVAVGAGIVQLLYRLVGQVAEHQAVARCLLCHPVGRQVDRYTVCGVGFEQPLDLGSGGDV